MQVQLVIRRLWVQHGFNSVTKQRKKKKNNNVVYNVDTYIAEQRLHTVAKEHNFSYPKVIHLSDV